jgi:tetratricopeptide (TPR) repeat protein
MDGRLEETVELLERDLAWRQQVGLPRMMPLVGFRALQYLGRIDDDSQSPLQQTVLEGMNVPVYRIMPVVPAQLGRVEEANQRLDRMLKARPNITSTNDMTQSWVDGFYLEAALLVKHRQAAELLLRRLASSTLVFTASGCIPRLLGGAAVLVCRYDEGRQHYDRAIKVCTEMRFRPELALSHLQLAELLLEHCPDDKQDALAHLDFAIREFREMKMLPSLERALRHKEILKA